MITDTPPVRRLWGSAAAAVVLKACAGLALALLLQVGLLNDIRVVDRVAATLLVLAVAGGLTGGSSRGSRLGFTAGLLYDLVADTPLGLAAFSYGLSAYLAGYLQGTLTRYWPMLAPFSALGLGLFVLLGELFGQDHLFEPRFWATVAVVVIWSLILAPAMLWLTRWIWRRRGAERDLV